ncbi:MAG: adenosine kinase [Pseudomonadota bacterium]
MSDYDLYAIGNALVDFECRVSEDELSTLGVDKGLMTLIDADRRQALIDGLGTRDTHRACGGSAANTVIALAQLGGRGFYSCRVANDETGDFYLTDLTANGVDSNLVGSARPDGDTGTCIVLVTPDTERSMSTFLGATADIDRGAIDADALTRSRFLYVEGYLVASPTGRAAAIEAHRIARDAGVPTALTLSDVNMVAGFRDGLLAMAAPRIELLFGNRDEALLMTETDTIAAAGEALRRDLADTVVITDGANGCTVFTAEGRVPVDATRVTAVDSNGAGDMFAGAYLFALSQGAPHRDAAALACRAASRVVAHFGPRLPAEVTRAIRDEA